MVLGLDHAQLMIPPGGEAAARRFYCELLGLVEIPKPEELRARGGLWLEAGGQQIHLGVEEASFDRSKTRAHVGLLVDDLDAHRARLEAGGVTVTSGTQPAAFRRIEVRDPFGNRIELLHNTGALPAPARPDHD